MKVLYFLHYSELYGANRSFLNLIDGLGDKVQKMAIIPDSGAIENELNKRRVAYFILPFEWSTYERTWLSEVKRPLRILRRLTNILRVAHLVKNYEPDILHSNSSVITVGMFTSLYLNIPHVWHIREFGLDDYNLHYDFGESGKRWLINKSDHIINISESISEYVRGKESNQTTIYNGIFDKNEIAEFSDCEEPISNFGIVGYILPNKGQEEAIRAFSQTINSIPDAHLFIIGTGRQDYIEYLQKLAEKLNVSDRVTFTGFIVNQEEIYKKIHVLLVCSKKEGMGRVIPEAMIRGIPIIGRKVGAIPELIEHKFTGFLYSTTQELAENMIALHKSRKLYRSIRQKAFLYANQTFLIEGYANSVFQVYQKILYKRRKNAVSNLLIDCKTENT